jgi:uncharacterized protein YebE (UPF0316 family)
MSTNDLLAGSGVASAVAMAGMALVSVGLWTLRVTLAAKGRKLLGAGAAAVEAVVFALVFSSLAASLDSPSRLVGYAIGVAAGTLLGLYLDERGSRGTSEVQLVVHGRDRRVAESLRRHGWPATSYFGDGPDGPVTVTFVAVNDAEVGRVVDVLDRDAPQAFWAVQSLRRMHPVPALPWSGVGHHPPVRRPARLDGAVDPGGDRPAAPTVAPPRRPRLLAAEDVA